ncbi:hypothetical protein RFI_15014 [Reticulomyxa filosa]|uniref:Anoctamin transmembrane domain-containing protein n=1 Tax=Reticulomyxa filosa TaxID=46433 RepID=X6N8E4_RETFI|nr:hypothetical protein RFI_15014 [Reticulomyxa filosa]|eukprot:ETO22183.1 hypothetical protein RFI_15014 [Reticulomyxa filosa]
MWVVPVILNSIGINCLNKIYSKVAELLTSLENWKYQCEFDNSLILKRFLFEFLDAYLPLFYVAFYQMDITKLQSELLGLFLADEIRRVVVESVLPTVYHYVMYSSNKIIKKQSLLDKLLEEKHLEEYEYFDDYLEMITQFGYITLFASAYPLAALLAWIENLFEVWSDSYRLCYVTKRPNIVYRSNNMNKMWLLILNFMAWVGILTNTFLFAFTTEQMEEWFPDWYQHSANDDTAGFQEIKSGKGRYVVLVMFLIEHLIGIFAYLIHFLLDDHSSQTKDAISKRKFLLKQIQLLPKTHSSS